MRRGRSAAEKVKASDQAATVLGYAEQAGASASLAANLAHEKGRLTVESMKASAAETAHRRPSASSSDPASPDAAATSTAPGSAFVPPREAGADEHQEQEPLVGEPLAAGAPETAVAAAAADAALPGAPEKRTVRMKEKAAAAAATASAGFEAVHKVAAPAVEERARLAKEKASHAAAAVKDQAGRVLEEGLMPQQKMAEAKRFLQAWAVRRIMKDMKRVTARIPVAVKRMLEDPQMPRIVSRYKDKVVDAYWPHVREELLHTSVSLAVGELRDPDLDLEKQQTDIARPSDCFRAWARYLVWPYDRGIWASCLHPLLVLLGVLKLLPFGGIDSLAFLFLFLVMDRRDRCQLHLFIVNCKCFHFFSQGLLRSVSGYLSYLGCIVPLDKDQLQHSCSAMGPGLMVPIFADMIGVVLHISLCWAAFLCMKFGSSEKGRSTVRKQAAANAESAADAKGGARDLAMQRLLLYDLAALSVVVFAWLGVVAVWKRWDWLEWPAKQVLYGCQILYGYSSAPFVLLSLPFAWAVVGHMKETGYDRTGVCKPKDWREWHARRREVRRQVRQRQQEAAKAGAAHAGGGGPGESQDAISEADAQALTKGFREILAGGSVAQALRTAASKASDDAGGAGGSAGGGGPAVARAAAGSVDGGGGLRPGIVLGPVVGKQSAPPNRSAETE